MQPGGGHTGRLGPGLLHLCPVMPALLFSSVLEGEIPRCLETPIHVGYWANFAQCFLLPLSLLGSLLSSV